MSRASVLADIVTVPAGARKMDVCGTRSSYVTRGCRCELCRAAIRRYEKARRLAGGVDLVDAGPVREHIKRLQAAGVGRRRIQQLSGASLTSISRLSGLDRSRPARRVTSATAAAILAVRPLLAAGSCIDATGTVRRLRALVAIGWTHRALAERIGWTEANFGTLINHRQTQVTVATARAVAGLYDELCMTPGPSERAWRSAARKGWASALAWDDDTIDNPAAASNGIGRIETGGLPGARRNVELLLEDFEHTRDAHRGLVTAAAMRLEMRPASLARALNRAKAGGADVQFTDDTHTRRAA